MYCRLYIGSLMGPGDGYIEMAYFDVEVDAMDKDYGVPTRSNGTGYKGTKSRASFSVAG